jgi:hypothetical protein
MSDLGIEELAPGRYAGLVKKIEYSGKKNIKIVITYRFDTPAGPRELEDRELIGAPQSSANYFRTTSGLARVRDILKVKGLTLADADYRSLKGLLEGVGLTVITGNKRTAGFNTPFVIRVEKP